MSDQREAEAKEDDRTAMLTMRRTERLIRAALGNGRMETPGQKKFWRGLRLGSQALAGAAMENVRR